MKTLAILIGIASLALAQQPGQKPAAQIIYAATLPAACNPALGQIYFKTTATLGPYYCSATNTWSPLAQAATTVTHAFVCNIGSATSTTVISTGDTGCYSDSGSFSGTISRVDIIGNAAALATCSITVDVWKANAALPTSGSKISASAPATLSTANKSQSGSLSGWTTSVANNDIWGASVASVTGCVYAQVRVEFQ